MSRHLTARSRNENHRATFSLRRPASQHYPAQQDMKTLRLVSGEAVLVSYEDFEDLSQFRWYALRLANGLTYARRVWQSEGRQREERMHRRILKAVRGQEIDHINLNGLDNQRENLRIATRSQNMCNRRTPTHNTSGVKGVYWDRDNLKWRAAVNIDGTVHRIGRFLRMEDAEAAVTAARTQLHKQYARHNELIETTEKYYGTEHPTKRTGT